MNNKALSIFILVAAISMVIVYLTGFGETTAQYHTASMSENCHCTCECASGIPCECTYVDGECNCTSCEGRIVYGPVCE